MWRQWYREPAGAGDGATGATFVAQVPAILALVRPPAGPRGDEGDGLRGWVCHGRGWTREKGVRGGAPLNRTERARQHGGGARDGAAGTVARLAAAGAGSVFAGRVSHPQRDVPAFVGRTCAHLTPCGPGLPGALNALASKTSDHRSNRPTLTRVAS